MGENGVTREKTVGGGAEDNNKLLLPSLEILSLYERRIKKISRGFLNSFPALKSLNLDRDHLTNLEPDTFLGTPNLARLGLSGNNPKFEPGTFRTYYEFRWSTLEWE